MAVHVFLPAYTSINPFSDLYTKTIFRMDKTFLMRIPKLDDNEFMLNLARGVDNMPGLIQQNSVFDDKLDDQLRSQAEIEEQWEELVVAGPITVNYLANLMILASQKDFPFARPTPDYVFKYIRHPLSFRATLAQVSGDVYQAFLGAHTSMDQIQLFMQQIPGHIKTSLKLLTTASPQLISTLLPLTLKTHLLKTYSEHYRGSIERIANDCVKLANQTVNKFDNLMALLQEIIEISLGTETANQNAINGINALINSSHHDRELLEFEIQQIQQGYQAAQQALKKAQEDYAAAYHAIPTLRFWSALGNFIVGAVNVIGGILGIFGGGGGDNNLAFENAKQKAELAYKQLKEAEARYDIHYQQLLQKQNKMVNIILEISKLNLDKIDPQEIIRILVSATKELSTIQKQWDKLIRFFRALSSQAESTQKVVVHEFVGVIQAVQQSGGVLDEADREFYVMLLVETAAVIDRGAHLLFIMSRTYYDISAEYMMNQIAAISGLLTIQTNGERELLLQQLGNNTLQTSAKVSRLAQTRKQQYEERNQARQDELARFIQQSTLDELESVVG
ncbi:unnamed protein product [Didymodactylos carnosus]|uniref:Uncharacterized protein n=1 Tax=Didymodactylos carnosus TaxID=1234261 RepID=A0A814XCM7_9BILA|nr:unnamed protein product [Didymodactylos carnosus]CAF1214656.1 unnamed protein product [Didymodactylos carnosus]CAF3728213.1 unnamed protein product [Didymodactylos carnosus]CAF3978511.1 unnamed protein product [Didymodactylos carnosus]